jgi:predicted exporter
VKRRLLGGWLVLLLFCVVVVARARYTADLAAFLPASPSETQQILVDQLREGAVARVLLLGMEGAETPVLAALSNALVRQLSEDDRFGRVHNGAADVLGKDATFVIENRYVLSAAVTPERFSPSGLRAALQAQLDRLASPLSVAVTPVLARDATGEVFEIAERLQPPDGPHYRDGVWFAQDGTRALLTVYSRAPGFDLDAQEHALDAIREAFEAERSKLGVPAQAARLLLAGPAVFAVNSRSAMRQDVTRVSALATLGVVGLLLFALRSPRIVGITLLPVVAGALAGVAAVSLAYGSVHGVTLGFGATLLGEAVDYAIYFFGGAAGASSPRAGLLRIWPTLRLGLVTSLVGFGALIFSGFPGLAQLGLFSCIGLAVALLATRWVLPEISPAMREPPLLRTVASWIPSGNAHWRPLIYTLAGACMIWLAVRGGSVWNDELAVLSPVPQSDLRLDEAMRSDLGLPDVRHIVVVSADSEQAALEGAEAVGARLDALIGERALAGYDSPAAFLPSVSTQRMRQQAIPEEKLLRANLAKALQGLPFRQGLFEPFLAEAAEQRIRAPLQPADVRLSVMAAPLESLLITRRSRTHALMPLRGVTKPETIEAQLRAAGVSAVLLDLKTETDSLYRSYRQRVVAFSLLGAAAIAAVLLFGLGSLRRTWRVLAPLVAAILVTAAFISIVQSGLTVFHLVALLLVVGVGSNYTLFFEHFAGCDNKSEPQRFSLVLCSLTTIIGFGAVGLAQTPVLSMIGGTVALGAALSLLFAALMAESKSRIEDCVRLKGGRR